MAKHIAEYEWWRTYPKYCVTILCGGEYVRIILCPLIRLGQPSYDGCLILQYLAELGRILEKEIVSERKCDVLYRHNVSVV